MIGAEGAPHVALATCKVLPEEDFDETLLLDALSREGVVARMLAWDGEEPLPDHVDLVVLRSTWNYASQPRAFLEWVNALSKKTGVLNPMNLVRWNIDKRYLADLLGRGIAIVPTEFVPQGSATTLARIRETRRFGDVVVKPQISAGSWLTSRFGADEKAEGEAFFQALVKERDVLVQPYVASVEGRGERSMVFFEGAVRHAVRKSPRFNDDAESVVSVPVADDERRFAEAVLAPFREQLLYARVDVARDEADALMVMELELIEPSLFFREHPGSVEIFARAIAEAARRARARRA